MGAIDEVRLWALDGGKGHVARSVVAGRVSTLCDRIGPFETTAERPRRICGICRRRLAKAAPVKETAPGGGAP